MLDWSKYKDVGGSYQVDRWWASKNSPLKEGDFIEGRLVSKTPKREDGSAVYVLEDDMGVKIGVNGGTVLDGKFENIGVGAIVAIEYLGEKPSKNRRGKYYKDFRVGVHHSGD